MLASLPWYDLDEVRAETDQLWDVLKQHFRQTGFSSVPETLNRQVAYERQWTSSAFFFGQACGYDVRMAYAEHLQAVVTPCYDVPGCQGSQYRSFVVVRADSDFQSVEQLRGTRCVINTPTSHSGMNVLRALVAPMHCDGRFFAKVSMSGAHERSLRMIQSGQVDVAAIDCVTYALLARYRPAELAGTRVIHHTNLVPAPPFVTASNASPATVAGMRRAVVSALQHPDLAEARSRLMISGVEVLPEDAYGPIESLDSDANHRDYYEIPGRDQYASMCTPGTARPNGLARF
ncbi:MAG: phosphate/phosphite/phosphonate ABC transporter substrate-binding protein [Pirellulaceae bacterium]